MAAEHLIDAARTFRSRITDADYAPLAEGQRPAMLFISCSDSRVMPARLTDARPGQLFELRTAGAIVPRYPGGNACGVSATIEFALTQLGIRHIVVCGHSHCGAVAGLLSAGGGTGPALSRWLRQPHLSRVRDTGDDRSLRGAVEDHVANQLSALDSHPRVRDLAASGELTVDGWYYEVHTGAVTTFDPATRSFRPL
ncbi:carbonic anhydrase [Amycolatopsis sp.]|uniref:carbonic anhydrase n=1 Tax=Amycolatopsis sp. TaxID=37632 RepID=UPI002D1CE671|nr:carbonic anhydrase [Amycolatopsis sp.]HVV12232.1 carbonic anhydrase [Amycolatopsis sp.]